MIADSFTRGELEHQRTILKRLIAEEEQRKVPDHLKIKELKKLKLLIKDLERTAPP